MALHDYRHLEEDEIERYSTGIASEKECARFDEHLLVCEFCRNRVTQEDDYGLAIQSAGLRWRQQARLREAGWRDFPRLIPLSYALGLVAALTLIALLALGALRPWTRGAAPVFAVHLEALRGAGIESRAPAGRALLLDLDLTGLPAQKIYRVEAVDRLGNVVWQGTVPAQDSRASVSLPSMPAGIYFVRVYASSGELVREYGLEVEG